MHRMLTRWSRLLACLAVILVAAGCFQQAGREEFQAPISQALPTDTPTPTATEPPPPTDTPEPTLDVASLGQGGDEGTPADLGFATTDPLSIAQVPTLDILNDPFGATATTNYLLSTGQDLYVTATAIVVQATQTVDAQLTATAQVFFPPTFTPSPTFQTGVSAPLVPGADCIHEVRAEDRNLYRISLRYGVTVREIAQASGIANINLIVIGQKLTIPGCGTLGVTPPPTSTVAAAATPLSGAPGAAPVTTGGRIHVVEQGETLFEISLLYGVPVSAIAAANGIANINLIYLGQELVIP